MIYASEAEAALLDRSMPSWREAEAEEVEPILLAIRALSDGQAGALSEQAPPVWVALARAKGKVAAVAKERQATGGGQSYRFRGIDQILGAVHSAHAEEGIVILPHDLEVQQIAFAGDGWRGFFVVRVHLLWEIIGPAGDRLYSQSWGEALDNADKGLGKARSYAQKDFLIRLHEIPTDDPDVGDTEATAAPADAGIPAGPAIELASPEAVGAIVPILEALLEDSGGDYAEIWRERRAGDEPGTYRIETLRSMAAGDRPCPPIEAIQVMHETMAEWRAHLEARKLDPIDPDSSAAGEAAAEDDAMEEPKEEGAKACQICGSTRAQLAEHDGIWRCRNASDCSKRVAAKAAEAVVSAPPIPAAEEEAEEPADLCPACGFPVDPEAAAVDLDGEIFHQLCAGDVKPDEEER